MVSSFIGLFMAALISFGGIGVKKNPSAPSAAQVMVYAPSGADYFAYGDWQAVIPPLWKTFVGLDKEPIIRDIPEVVTGLQRMRSEMDMGLSMLKTRVGVDVIEDIDWGAVWFKVNDDGDPSFLVVVRGKFPADLLDKLGGMMRTQPIEVNGVRILRDRPNEPVIGVAADGAVMVGTEAWVLPRLSGAWKAPRAKKGSFEAHLATVLKPKPFAVLASMPSAAARTVIGKAFGRDAETVFIADVLGAHKVASVALRYNGLDLTWQARTDRGFATARLGIEGALDLMRAGHPAARGLVRFGLAGLHSYAARSDKFKQVLKFEKEIVEYIDQWTGDGRFKANLKADKRSRTVTLSASDKSLARVVPVSALLPVLGLWFVMDSPVDERTEPAPVEPMEQ